MPTSKFTLFSISILIGLLVLTSFLSIPVQAKSVAGDVQQSGDPAGKPPTKTKRPRATPVPKTATPKPASTVAKTATAMITSSATLAGTGTPMSSGTPVGTGTFTATPMPTYTFSSGMNTVVAQLTATSGEVYKTSTAAALTASSTPTKFGAPTSTPNNLEQTATSIVLTTVPTSASWQSTVTLPAETSDANEQIPVASEQPAKIQSSGMIFWVSGAGLLILLFLIYLLSKELRKSSTKSK